MGARALRITACLLCMVLAAACSSSESSSAPTEPPPTSGNTSIADTTAVATTAADVSVRLLAGTPMVECTVASGSVTGATADALCGTLQVPEDRSDPSGRQIGLRVAVVPAQASVAEPDAFVALAGGPGEAGANFFG